MVCPRDRYGDDCPEEDEIDDAEVKSMAYESP